MRNEVTNIPLIAIVLLFVLASAAAAYFSPQGSALQYGADYADYWQPARGLIEFGRYVDVNTPNSPYTYRTPGYAIFVAGMTWFTNGGIYLLISVQVLLLFLTGVLARSIFAELFPRLADLGFALVIFNPNAFVTAQLVQTDTVGTFFFVLAIWSLWKYRKAGLYRFAGLLGVALSIASLIRPTTQHLIYLLPLGLPLVMGLTTSWQAWFKHFIAGLVGLVLGLLIVLPWLSYMNANGEGYSFSSARVKWVYVLDNVQLLDQERYGGSIQDANTRVFQKQQQFIDGFGPGWHELSKPQQYKILSTRLINEMLNYPVSTIVKSAMNGLGNLFVGGGATNYHRLFGLAHKSSWDIRVEKSGNYLHGFLSSLGHSSPLAASITIFCVTFAFLMRVLGVLGIYLMIRRKAWPEILIVIGSISFFAVVHIFNSAARYRLPIEPLLFLLVLYALDWFRNKAYRRVGA